VTGTNIQIVANLVAALGISSVLIIGLALAIRSLKGASTTLPAHWTPQQQLRFRRARSLLYILGPLSWCSWLLFPAGRHLGLDHGLLESQTAFGLAALASYIFLWLQAIAPGNYSRRSNPMLLVMTSLIMSGLAIVLAVTYQYIIR
jgi:hypothetical protein